MSTLLAHSYQDRYGIQTFQGDDGIVQFRVIPIKQDKPAEGKPKVALDLFHISVSSSESLGKIVLEKIPHDAKEQVEVSHLMSKLRQDDRSKEVILKYLLDLGFKLQAQEKEGWLLVKEL